MKGVSMKVYEVKLKMYLMHNIKIEEVQSVLAQFIDTALSNQNELLEFHYSNEYKNYCFNNLFPLEPDRVYHQGKVYTVTLRTISQRLDKFFKEHLVKESNQHMKALSFETRILPKKHIEKIYTITPAIMKNDSGYWRTNMAVGEYERRLKENLIKKYNSIVGEKMDEDFQLYTSIEFNNRLPVPTAYKDITLLGDKITLMITEHKNAQELAYLCIGTGLLENNARGFGFCNFRWV